LDSVADALVAVDVLCGQDQPASGKNKGVVGKRTEHHAEIHISITLQLPTVNFKR
jgi:hypothetical protein